MEEKVMEPAPERNKEETKENPEAVKSAPEEIKENKNNPGEKQKTETKQTAGDAGKEKKEEEKKEPEKEGGGKPGKREEKFPKELDDRSRTRAINYFFNFLTETGAFSQELQDLITKDRTIWTIGLLSEVYFCRMEGIKEDEIKKALGFPDPEATLKQLRHAKNVDESGLNEKFKEQEEQIKVLMNQRNDANRRADENAEIARSLQKEKDRTWAAWKKEQEKNSKLPENEKTRDSAEGRRRAKFRWPWGKPARADAVPKEPDKKEPDKIEDIREFMADIALMYTPEQEQFIFDCIDEDMPVRIIKEIIAPSLPVDVMKRLKKRKESELLKEAMKNGSGS